jgi:two-component system cell cycle response regulator
VSSSKVLIADDSPLVLRMMEDLLSKAGLQVVTARDGIEAVEKAFSDDVGLVILDVVMPRMNGYQACRLLKTEPATQFLPVLILTSRDQAADRFWGLETGADYYLTKDAEPKRIVELVQSILSRESARPRPRPKGRQTSVDILSRVNDLLDHKLYEATVLSEIGRVARSLVHFDETFTSVMNIVARVCDFSLGAMAFADDDDLEIVLMERHHLSPAVVEEMKAKLLGAINDHPEVQPFSRTQIRLFELPQKDSQPPRGTLEGFATFPIVTNNRLAGLLALGGRGVARLPGDNKKFWGQVANQAHIVMENSRLFDRVKNLSIRDGLTDLFNHRHSMELVASECGRVGRYEGGVSVAMMDIDHFKTINDEHGHPAGDLVLKETARVLRGGLRAVDSLGRYGGEEFVAILPHTDRAEALRTAERLRKAIEEHTFRVGRKPVKLSVSVGVASYPSAGVDSPSALIREADKALYRAKEAGRNRVE